MKIFSTCPFCVPEVEGGGCKTGFNIKKYMHKKCKTKNKRKGYDSICHIKGTKKK